MNRVQKSVALFLGILGATLAQAGTISVTSPNAGDFLGQNNQVSFNITNASAEVTVRVRAQQVSDPTVQISVENKFTPNADGKVSGNISLNFTSGFPNGAYNVTITATEPGSSFNSLPAIPVTVDVKSPKFLAFNPVTSRFVRDNVFVSALFEEDNMKEWRVKVGGADIPNNTGDTNDLFVTWNSNLELIDGSKNIIITAEDKAGNTVNQTINVTLDRLPPSSTVLAPNSNDRYFGNARIPVVVNIADQFQNALDERTVDVFIRDISGNFVTRVARRSIANSGSTLTWTGRIRDLSQLPEVFDLVVSATDKAGNAATEQVVRIERNRSRVHIEKLTEDDEPADSETVVDKGILWKKNTLRFGLRRRH